jgi:hypothetical protein
VLIVAAGTCLPSCCLETAIVYLLILQVFYSNSCTSYNIYIKWLHMYSWLRKFQILYTYLLIYIVEHMSVFSLHIFLKLHLSWPNLTRWQRTTLERFQTLQNPKLFSLSVSKEFLKLSKNSLLLIVPDTLVLAYWVCLHLVDLKEQKTLTYTLCLSVKIYDLISIKNKPTNKQTHTLLYILLH